jgi:hypothetical protein
VIPAQDVTYGVIWNSCDAFAGASIASNSQIALDVYPNPSSEFVFFRADLNGSAGRLQISDLSGRSVMEMGVSDALTSVNVSNLVEGIYFYELTSGNKTATGRFIKK